MQHELEEGNQIRNFRLLVKGCSLNDINGYSMGFERIEIDTDVCHGTHQYCNFTPGLDLKRSLPLRQETRHRLRFHFTAFARLGSLFCSNVGDTQKWRIGFRSQAIGYAETNPIRQIVI